MNKSYFISAICTPLTATDGLHEEGLASHLDAQWSNGIQGILVAGTMGLMQLLRDDTYQALCRKSIELTKGRGEVMIGAGDTSLSRTLARVEFLNTLKGVDSVVVLSPFFMSFSQSELFDYFTAIANASKVPLYLYDVPHWTRSKIELQTVVRLAEHPNIKGIKCSDQFVSTRLLIDAVPDQFRVIVAQPLLVDAILKFGVYQHLDGLFALAPKWTHAMGTAADRGDWETAGRYQRKIAQIASLLPKYGVFPASTAILNSQGAPGRFGPRPYQMLNEQAAAEFLAEPIVKELLTN